MSEFKFSSTQALSLGQKQKIVIASALATKSNILILDEPTSMLDPISKKQIYYILDKLKKDGITIIYITHLLEETLFLSDKIILLENRKIEKNISLSEVLENICILKEFNLSLPTILNLLVSFKENNININLENFTEDEIIKKIISEIKK